MTTSSPSAETIQFIIKILSARPTPIAEVPVTIANIHQTLQRLGQSATQPGRAALPAVERQPGFTAPRLGRPPGRSWSKSDTIGSSVDLDGTSPSEAPSENPVLARTTRSAPPATVAASPASTASSRVEVTAGVTVTPVIIPERPRRGRPRRLPLTTPMPPKPSAIDREEAMEAEIAAQLVLEQAQQAELNAQPRLLRRAEMQAGEQEHHPLPASPVLKAPSGTIRGIVKWFDGRSGKGALRLTGISGDIVLEAAMLEQSGIKRVYKDQEIEAVIEDQGGRPKLISLAVPGRTPDSVLRATAGEVTGTVRRQPRSVMVEIKPNGFRKNAARAEAEQVLGGVGRVKIPRRLTP